MSKEISFFVDGKIIVIERFEDETNPEFAERSSFILFFRNDPKFNLAKFLSFHHTQKMFNGVTYKPDFEQAIATLREEILKAKNQ